MILLGVSLYYVVLLAEPIWFGCNCMQNMLPGEREMWDRVSWSIRSGKTELLFLCFVVLGMWCAYWREVLGLVFVYVIELLVNNVYVWLS